MKKLFIQLLVLLFIVGSYAAWNQFKLMGLNDEKESIQNAIANYSSEGIFAEEAKKYTENSERYPAFFTNEGMTPKDLSVRTDLHDEAADFVTKTEKARDDFAADLRAEYHLNFGAKERIDEIVSLHDHKVILDITDFSKFYAERNEFFDLANKYCDSDTSKEEFLDSHSDFPETKLEQLAKVLSNAEKNLCPKGLE